MPDPRVPEVLAIIMGLILCGIYASYLIYGGEVYSHPDVYLP